MSMNLNASMGPVVEPNREEKMRIFRALISDEARLALIYSTILELQEYVVDLEKKASAMTSPEALQGMMSNFMGGGLFG